MGFDLVLKGFISDKTLIVKDYTNEILEFKTISIWIIYKKNAYNSCECYISLK
jgi:hypothetical protein